MISLMFFFATAISLCRKNWFFEIRNKRTFEIIFIAKQAERFTWDALIKTIVPRRTNIIIWSYDGLNETKAISSSRMQKIRAKTHSSKFIQI